ncbi:MAG TPA: DnaB-like helicase N-terminal domain-containing protein, partial [Dehalococcoidales bacterium]
MNGEKIPPYNNEAEESVVGSLLIDGAAIYKIASLLQPADFYSEQCQLVYGTCLTLYQRNETIDQITVAQELDRQGKLAACGGAAYLSHLIADCVTSLDIEHHAQIVYRLAISRRLIEAARRIEAIGYEAGPDVDTSLNKAEDVLFKLRHGQSPRDFIPIRQVLDRYFEPPPVAEREGYPALITHILSGFAGLDEFLGGLQRSDLIIVAGRPSMGKTSLALSIASKAAIQQGACVAL